MRYNVINEVTIEDQLAQVGDVVELDEVVAAPFVESGDLELIAEGVSGDEPASESQPEAGADAPAEETASETPATDAPATADAPAAEAAPADAPKEGEGGWMGGHTV